MQAIRLSIVAALLAATSSAVNAQERVLDIAAKQTATQDAKLQDWRVAWRKSRNELIDNVKDLAFDPSSVVVKWKKEATKADIEAIKLGCGLRVEPIETWEILPGVEHLKVDFGNAESSIRALREMPLVDYAEFDHIVHANQAPNDPSYGVLWGLHNVGQTVNADPGIANADINAPEAWTITTGSASVVIADIDSGVNYNHPDLAANAWLNPGEIAGNGIDDDGNGRIDDMRGFDFFNNDADPMDDNGHGTHTAGTFAGVANNGLGVVGVTWSCKVMALKFLSGTGSGATTGAIGAINYAVQKGVKVSNNSWGGGAFSQALFDAIAASRAINHVFVAAAGNDGLNTDISVSYPQGYAIDNIISVAASDNNDARASFSNYGATSVDLAAPGVNIYSTYLGTYSYLNGTSMATPHVTGVVALVQTLSPTWTYTQVRDRILQTIRPVAAFNGITTTGGVLDAFAAVNLGAPINNTPVVAIATPTSNSIFPVGSVVSFSASANDVEDGALTALLSWTSSIDGVIGTGAAFSRTLTAGTHIVSASVTDSGSRTGAASVTINIQAPPPANDPCSGSILLSNGVAFSGSIATATNDGTATCGTSTTAADAWFRYTAAGTSTVTINTCGSTFDTVLSVYTGACGARVQTQCNDDSGAVGPCPNGTTSYVTFTPVANTTYLIRVAGFNGARGNYTVRASGGTATIALPTSPSSLRVARTGTNSVLTWTDRSTNETLFRIERQQQINRVWTNTLSRTVGSNVTTFSDPVTAGVWRWRIRAENSAGASAWTGYVQQTVR
jgi:subtilisin family serine protease